MSANAYNGCDAVLNYKFIAMFGLPIYLSTPRILLLLILWSINSVLKAFFIAPLC